jgi:hypothetical protein
MTDQIKTRWRKGLFYFCALAFLFVVGTRAFETPDGYSLFYGFARILGIGPGIPFLGGTLHIYNLLLIIAAIICAIRLWQNWRGGYNTQFNGINPWLLRLPVFIGIIVLMASNMFLTPSVTDRAYAAVMSRRPGIESISVQNAHLRIAPYQGDMIFTYTFALTNFGHEHQEFFVKISYYRAGYAGLSVRRHETLILDDEGQPKLFHIWPRTSILTFAGHFSANYEQSFNMWDFSLVLIDIDGNEFIPRPVVRHVHMRR